MAVKGCSGFTHSTRRCPWDPLILMATVFALTPDFEVSVGSGDLRISESDTGQGPEFLGIPAFSITEPPDELSWCRPLPTGGHASLKELLIFSPHKSRDPVSTVSLDGR